MKELTKIIDDLPNDLSQVKIYLSEILSSKSDLKSHLSQLYSILTSVKVTKSASIPRSILSSNLDFLTNKETSIVYMQLFMILSKSFQTTELSRIAEENNVFEMIIKQVKKLVNEKDSLIDLKSVFGGLDYWTCIESYFEFLEFLNKFTCNELELSVEKSLIKLIYFESSNLKLQSVFFKSYTKSLRFMKLCNNYYRSIKVCGEVISELAEKLSPGFFKLFKYLLLKINKNYSILLENKKFNCVIASDIIGFEYLVTLFYNSQKLLHKKSKRLIYSLLTCFSPKIASDIPIFLNYSVSILIKFIDKLKPTNQKRLINLANLLIYRIESYKTNSNSIEVFTLFKEESKNIKTLSPLLIKDLKYKLRNEFKLRQESIMLEIDEKQYGPQKDLKLLYLTSDQILLIKKIDNIIEVDSQLLIESLVEHSEIFWTLFDIVVDEEIDKDCYLIAKSIKNGPLYRSVEEYFFNAEEYNLKPISVQMEFFYSLIYKSNSKRWLRAIKCLNFDIPIFEFLIGFLGKNPNFFMFEDIVKLICNFAGIQCLDDDLFFEVIKALLSWILKNPIKFPDVNNDNFFETSLLIIISQLNPTHYQRYINLIKDSIDFIATFLISISESKLKIIPLQKIKELDPELLTIILSKIEESISILDLNKLKSKMTMFSKFNHNPRVLLSKLIDALMNYQQDEKVYEDILEILESEFKDFKMNLPEFQNFINAYLIPSKSNSNSDLTLWKKLKLRRVGFKIVYLQCKSDSKKIPILLDGLNLHLSNKTWRKTKKSYWNINANTLDSCLIFKGLDNPGTICYSNSFIQQLFHVPTFIDPLLSLYTKEKNCLSALQKVFVKLKFSSQSSVSSNGLIKSCIGRKGLHKQMDTDEFISKLFEKCSKSELGYQFDEIVQKNFIGTQNLEIKCKRCERVCNKTQDFKNIGLQIFKKEKNSLLNSLKKMTCREIITGENALFCASCKRKENSMVKMSFIELPLYLIFVVKRFEYNIESMTRVKINEVFEFTEDVNFMEFVNSNIPDYRLEKFEYQLKGVINHRGTAEQGHYISYLKTSKNEWVEFNDSETSKLSISEVLKRSLGEPQGDSKTTSAYLIIYKKVEEYSLSSNKKISNFNLTPCESLFFPKIMEKNREIKFREILFCEEFAESIIKFANFQEFDIFFINYCLSCFFRMKLKTYVKMNYYRVLYKSLSEKSVIYLIEILSSSPGAQEFILCNPHPEHKTFLLTLIEKHIPSLDKSFLLLTFKRILKIYVEFSFSFYKCDVYLDQFFFLVINELNQDWKLRYINTIHLELLSKKPIKLNYEVENFESEFLWTENFKFVEEVNDYDQYNERCPFMFIKFMAENLDKFEKKVIENVKKQNFICNAVSVLKTKLGIIAMSQLYSLIYNDDINGALEYLQVIIESYTKNSDSKKLVMISLFFKYYPGRTELFYHFIEFYLDIFLAKIDHERRLFMECIIKSLRRLKYSEVSLVLSEETQEKLKNTIEIYFCEYEFERGLRKISNNFFNGVENHDFDLDDEIDIKYLEKKKKFWIIYDQKFREFEVDDNFCNRILRLEGISNNILLLDYVHFDRLEIFDKT